MAIAFALGALAGAVTALLLAPQSGRRTRQQVREAVGAAGKSLHKVPGALEASWRRATIAARAALEDALGEGDRSQDA